MDNSPQSRVMLWTLPRSLASPFVKWISHQLPRGSPNVQIIINPYATAHDVGPERAKLPDNVNKETFEKWNQLHEDPNGNDGLFSKPIKDAKCSFKFVQDLLEQDFRDKSVVFCKDFCYGISNCFDMLPAGYTHSFLIRNPYRTFLSWRNLMQRCLGLEKDSFDLIVADALYPVLEGYKKCWELLEHLQAQGENVVVVDADDIQQDPGAILKMYCARIGIAIPDLILQWDDGSHVMRDWISGRSLLNQDGDSDDAFFESTRFLPFQPAPKRHDIPFDILQYIDASMPYYLKMYAMRISL